MIKEREIDRTGWGSGPWDDEPDEATWIDTDTGLLCMALRNQMGNWCGYVGIVKNHPAYRIHYDGCTTEAAEARNAHFRKYMSKWEDAPPYPETPVVNQAVYDIRVHGGLTYSGYRNKDEIWYFGFDCGHCWDFSPGLVAHMKDAGIEHGADGEIYRTLEYVKEECRKLAKQLVEMK